MIQDIIAGFVSGMLGAMGFGGGGVLILYLTLYKNVNQLTAQGINLIFFIPTAIVALIKHHKNRLIRWEKSKNYIILGIVGIIAGYIIIDMLNETIIRKIFALILIYFGFKDLFIHDKKRV